ncbi:MAG: LysM peptidoglycan-binding domain-containing protein [Pseudarcicella sp.]|nr:LysM peptidoglycan-binding domain-containing protein [Pseudarcicella sp.]MBP6410113.1 LysM peptidoglycan-binding domain-containing protein [Pseudarcicella sp.]
MKFFFIFQYKTKFLLLFIAIILSKSTQIFGQDSTYVEETPIEVVEEQWLIDPAVMEPKLRSLERQIPLPYNKITHKFVEYFAFTKPSFTKKMLERKGAFFPLYERMLKKYNLPDELKYLSCIESGLNPTIMSHAGAGGLWQFMPQTARLDFGLKIDKYIDERFDPVLATDAACKYLGQLFRIFNDWHLALAAYNAGPGNIRRAIRKCGGSNFWDIYNCLPQETRSYVPLYIGIIYMINHHADHDIFPENIYQKIDYDTIHVTGYLDLVKLSKFGELSLDKIKELNPQIIKDILPTYSKEFVLRLPKSEMAYFYSNRKMILDTSAYVASKHLPTIIPQINPIETNAQLDTSEGIALNPDDLSIKENQKDVYLHPKKTTKTKKEDKKIENIDVEEIEEIVLRKKPKKKTHIVKHGDNLSDIAEKYGVDVYDIKKWNKLKSSKIVSRQKLIVYDEKSLLLEKKASKKKSKKETEKEVSKETKDKKKSSKSKKDDEEDEEIVSKKSSKSKKDKPEKEENSSKAKKSSKEKYYTVEKGDTFWSISRKNDNISIEEIKKLNHIKGDILKHGMKLKLK